MPPTAHYRRLDELVPFGTRLAREHLLVVVDTDPSAPYHAVRQGYVAHTVHTDDPRLATEPLCAEAFALETNAGHNRRGYIEGPHDAMVETIRALRICERMCTECADAAVGGLNLDSHDRARRRSELRAMRRLVDTRAPRTLP